MVAPAVLVLVASEVTGGSVPSVEPVTVTRIALTVPVSLRTVNTKLWLVIG